MTSSLVTLWKFRDVPSALLAQGKLRSAGIESFLANENLVRMNWLYSGVVGGISLQVPAERADEALELLQEPIPEMIDTGAGGIAYLQPRCPKCNGLDVQHEGLNKFVTYGTWLALGFPIRVTSEKWRCAACGHEWEALPEPGGDHAEVSPEVMTKIYVATTNAGKVKDFAAIAGEAGLDVVPFPKSESVPEVVEDGRTFEDNARKKAEAYSAYLPNELIIADDSGLEVDALGGAPGVFSARFAATAANAKPSDSDNNYKLLQRLSELPGCERAARFVCVIAVARHGKTLQTFRGEAMGEILQMPIGRHGFGYDPLFFVPALNKTFAEMNAEEKALHSHRGEAFRKFLAWLDPQVSD